MLPKIPFATIQVASYALSIRSSGIVDKVFSLLFLGGMSVILYIRNMSELLPQEIITEKIIFMRGQKVILDRDLAKLYGVETKVLNQAVSRNIDIFPHDFMFRLSKVEFNNWKSHFVTSNSGDNTLEADNLKSQSVTSRWGGNRKPPRAFTEQGIAMLSCVLKSKQARVTNIAIIRVFTHMRKILASNQELFTKIEHLETQILDNNESIQQIWFEIKKMLMVEEEEVSKIGFRVD